MMDSCPKQTKLRKCQLKSNLIVTSRLHTPQRVVKLIHNYHDKFNQVLGIIQQGPQPLTLLQRPQIFLPTAVDQTARP